MYNTNNAEYSVKIFFVGKIKILKIHSLQPFVCTKTGNKTPQNHIIERFT